MSIAGDHTWLNQVLLDLEVYCDQNGLQGGPPLGRQLHLNQRELLDVEAGVVVHAGRMARWLALLIRSGARARPGPPGARLSLGRSGCLSTLIGPIGTAPERPCRVVTQRTEECSKLSDAASMR